MPLTRQRNIRTGMTLTVAACHAALAILGLNGRLIFSRPSRYQFLLDIVGSPIWIVLHGLCALAIVVALLANRGHVTALGAGSGVMGAWAFLTLLWGLSVPDNPVSLVGPVLGGAVTVLAYLLTISWAQTQAGDRTTGG